MEWGPIKNPEGVTLYPCGVQTSEADWHFYVCFDNYYRVGGFMHCFRTTTGKRIVEARWERGDPLVFGTSMRNPGPHTGAGYRVTPEELGARAFAISRDGGQALTLGKRAENVAGRMMFEWGNFWRKATVDEQLRGIDFISLGKADRRLLAMLRGTIQVKGRSERMTYPELFLQTHEINTLRLVD